ncbi:bacteroides conjugative transposon TraK protein (plasmid) [Phocaeicola salanitronis DSM 18170]|uniref:Bacteroides conjugative transposon TraK protein n=1 Tax=Phocaeicola salanitronis (strain DSM 18170 / JCM 13657 / CCUG 60908 / BL78) TaxID=667015 RepID=F0R956_PHOSB|nr:conjugative transposon protein TraK [Phocaeicola salanitronis]ADY38177.1 bacteroides conjugative transposon TraK protein [Phocaeicola salanitronis DSM 18170]
MIIKNIENKIKLAGLLSIGSFISSIVISGMVLAFCFTLVREERKKIYVLDQDVPVLVKQTGVEVNLEVECKSHVNLFHSLFFTLPPDDDFIKHNMESAMYLVDESGLKQYNNLKEKGYFNTLLASSATVTIKTDSINMNMSDMSFTYYGTQRIERETSVLKRQLVTTGYLRQVPRTDNNPHGLIITNWKTILNKDLDYKIKKSF